MTGSGLPENVDTAYADGATADVKLHQQHHDSIHNVVNWFDITAVPTAGQVLTWDAVTGLYLPSDPTVGGGGGGAAFSAQVVKSGSTYIATAANGATIASGTGAHTVINAAITSVSASGGGVVFLRAATYLLTSSIIVKQGVILTGEGGWGRSADNATATVPVATIIRPNAGSFTGALIEVDSTAYSARIEQLVVDGDPASGANAECGIYVRAGDTNIRGVGVFECSVAGILVNTGSSASGAVIARGTSAASGVTVGVNVESCKTANCGKGVYIQSGTTDCNIYNCRILGSDTDGIHVDAGGAQVYGNHITSNATGATTSIRLSAAQAMIVCNYLDTVNTSTGFHIIATGTNRSTITGNHFTNMAPNKACIQIGADFSGTTITANTFTGSTNGRSFIQTTSTSFPSNAVVHGNVGERRTGDPTWVGFICNSAGTAMSPIGETAATEYTANNSSIMGNRAYQGTA